MEQAWEAISSGYSCNLHVCYFVAFLLPFAPFSGSLRIGKYPDVGIRFNSSRLMCCIFKTFAQKVMYHQYMQIWGFCRLDSIDSLDQATRLLKRLEGDTGSLNMFVSLQWSFVIANKSNIRNNK